MESDTYPSGSYWHKFSFKLTTKLCERLNPCFTIFQSLCKTTYTLLYQHCFLTCCILLIIFATISFCPLIVSESSKIKSISRFPNFYHSVYLQWLLVSVFVSVPMLSQVLLDAPKIRKSTEERDDWLGSLLLSMSLIVPNLCIYLLAQDEENKVSVHVIHTQFALFCIQQIAIILGISTSMFAHKNVDTRKSENIYFGRCFKHFSIEQQTVNVMISFTLANMFYILGKSTNSNGLLIISATFLAIPVVMLLFLTFKKVVSLSKHYLTYYRFSTHNHLSDFMYASALFCFIFADISVIITAIVSNAESSYLLKACIFVQIALTCFLSLIPGEKSKRLAEFKHEKLETRLNLIRYVSHEMRTPLNTANMGLTLIINELTSWKWKVRGANMQDSQHRGKDVPVRDLTAVSPTSRSFEHSQKQSIDVISTAKPTSNGLLSLLNTITVQALSDLIDTASQVNESCKVAISTLDDLLTFDKIDERKLVIEVAEIQPWNFLCSAAKPFAINARQAEVDFKVRLEDGSWLDNRVIRGDQFKLSQVVRNLVSNALKFANQGGKVEVILSKADHRHKDYARITVKDNGAGISLENQKKLFGQYVQFNAAALQQGKGSGLGLWITKSIVDMHKGYISVNSEGEGKGCAFHVDLPLFKKKIQSGGISTRRLISLNTAHALANSLRVSSTRESPLEEKLHSISIKDGSSARLSQNNSKSPQTPSSFRSSRNNSNPSIPPILASSRNIGGDRIASLATMPMKRISEVVSDDAHEISQGDGWHGTQLFIYHNGSDLHPQSTETMVEPFRDLEKNPSNSENSLEYSVHDTPTELFEQDGNEPTRPRVINSLSAGTLVTSSHIEAELQSYPSAKSKEGDDLHRPSLFNRLWKVFSTLGDRYQRDELDSYTINKHPEIRAISSLSGDSNRLSQRSGLMMRSTSNSSMAFLNHPIKFWTHHGSDFLASSPSLDIEYDEGKHDSISHDEALEAGLGGRELLQFRTNIHTDDQQLLTIIEEHDDNKVTIFEERQFVSADAHKFNRNENDFETSDSVSNNNNKPVNGSSKLIKTASSKYFSSDSFMVVSSKNRIIPTIRSESRDSIDVFRDLPIRNSNPNVSNSSSGSIGTHRQKDDRSRLRLDSMSADHDEGVEIEDDRDNIERGLRILHNDNSFDLDGGGDISIENSNPDLSKGVGTAWSENCVDKVVVDNVNIDNHITGGFLKQFENSLDENESFSASPVVRFIKRKGSKTKFVGQNIEVSSNDGGIGNGDAVCIKNGSPNHSNASKGIEPLFGSVLKKDGISLQGDRSIRNWECGLRILVVDDSAPNRKMFGRLLASKGHSVEVAVDGAQCVDIVNQRINSSIEHTVFDVIFMDDQMPKMTGTEATKVLRTLGFIGLIYGVTGDLYPETINRFVGNGANRVLGKPVNMEELKRFVDEDVGKMYHIGRIN